jgi:ketosteroid isomerase-like protein
MILVDHSKISVVALLILMASSNLPSDRVFAAEVASGPQCAAATYRQFDFWAGDWDVFDVDSPSQVAHAKVDLILDGCVLREDYQGADGHKGQSFTMYDAARNVWHQSWVTNRGELLEIEGRVDAGVMILSGEDHTRHSLVRGSWKPVNGEVRETAATSTDNGKTWKPWFDLVFRPTTSAMSPRPVADDKMTIAALDSQYQLAVKENDAATMDRILADDFILVTGSGKTYSKSDLLAEARSGRVQYGRQDDTDQTVRIWGDTAVITALLTEKGTDDGKPFDKTVWFSDTYRRTREGWRYVFGQSSLPASKGSPQ